MGYRYRVHMGPIARKCDLSTSYTTKLSTLEISIERRKCVDLWTLFPTCFCQNYPCDVQTTLPSLVNNALMKAILDWKRYPELIAIICAGINYITIIIKS